jgi:hypothetical protein
MGKWWMPRYSKSVIRIYDEAGNVTETHEHAGDFKEFELRTTRPCHIGLKSNMRTAR